MPRTPSAAAANNFDSLRLIFAVLVILSHSYPLGRGSNLTEPLSVLTHGQVTLGNLGVWSFFAISGFLITKSWIRSPSPVKFLKRRAGRIYPGFIAAGLVMALCIVPLVADPRSFVPVSLQSFFFQTLRLEIFNYSPVFIHNISPGVLNGSLWSIPFEFWCYIGVMLLGLTGLFRRRWLILAAFFGVIAFHLYLSITGASPGGSFLGTIFGYPPFWAMVLPFFLAGMLFHLFGGTALLRTPFVLLSVAVIVASAFVPHAMLITLPICWTYLLMWLAWQPALHPLHLGRYGDFSYGVYLYAFPIEQLIVMHAGGHMSPLKLFALATPASLVAGALSWFLVEKHFLSHRTQLKHEGNDQAPAGSLPRENHSPAIPISPRPIPSPPAEEAYVELKR